MITFFAFCSETKKMNFFRSFTSICVCFYLSIIYQLSLAADTIALKQSISDGQTLVSPGQRFELGFFSPGRSKNRYLGIWYKTTPDIVVWVANRNTPLTDSQGIFSISSNGTPVLLNSTDSIIWSSNVSRGAASPVVQLLDTGNLVLIDNLSTNLSNYLWQSFDYPGNTRLPGMLMGENSDTGTEQYLTSWRNADDPSPGDFIFKFENHGLPMMMILSMGTRKRYRTGPWNGIEFNGLPMFPKAVEDSIMVFNKERLISISDPYNSSVITRLTMNESGFIQRYILDGTKSKWNLMYSIPSNQCNDYGKCGPNGVCNSNISPACQCLKGFTPKYQQEWELFDWSSGCVRIEPSNCQIGDGFLKVSRVKLPDMLQFQLKMNMSLSECEAECLRNCSCTAYTNPYVSAGNSSCLTWYGDLVDIREYANEKSEQNVYVRLPISEIEFISGSSMKKKKRPLKVILISAASGVLFLGLVYGCIFLRMKRRKKELRRKEEDIELPLFDLATIAAATRSFYKENRIGEGGFGPVYKGNLSRGQEVAVKRLSKNSGQGAEEFKNEVISIAKLQHRNLVRLLGCCIQGEERMLIYEYMQNGSLDNFIFDPHRSELLIWPKRFDIIMGISRGLLYLHQDSRLKIIHRDLKTSNILLDSNLEPKISDFGLARIFGGDQTFVKTKRVIGTYGYMAPEYAIDGKFSEKSDVFSMGALILEIVSGKKNRSFSHPDHHHTLLGHAWLLWNENRALELMDPCLKDSFVVSQVKRCIQVGLLCVQSFAEDRPAMSSVVFMLGNEEAILPQPKQPGFFTERSAENAEKEASGSQGSNTSEMVTITQLEPR